MTETLCSAQDVLDKAGAGASTAVTLSGLRMTRIITETEGELVVATQRDWVTSYASVTAITKEIIRAAVSSKSAIKVAQYDRKGYTSKAEWITLLNVLNKTWDDNLKILNTDAFLNIRSVTE